MNNFPKGNDLIVKWAIKYSDGTPFPLENYAWELCYSAGRGINVVKDTAVISVSDNLLTWRFSGKDQAFYGKYSLTLRLYQQGKIVATVRKNNAFELSTTQYDGPCDIDLVSYCDNISLQDALLRGNKAMEVAQDAKTTAGSAVERAVGAETIAQNAVDAVNIAITTSQAANTTAGNAKTIADQAKATADNAAQTATNVGNTLAAKETELEARLDQLSPDQSGALALAGTVNGHTEKLSELKTETSEILSNVKSLEETVGISVSHELNTILEGLVDGYISNLGVVTSPGSGWYRSQPYLLHKGETISVSTGPLGNYPTLFLTDKATIADGDKLSFIPDKTSKEYTANEDTYVVINGNNRQYWTKVDITTPLASGLIVSKQDQLVSGKNIKTINGNSILGTGNLEIFDAKPYLPEIGGTIQFPIETGKEGYIEKNGTYAYYKGYIISQPIQVKENDILSAYIRAAACAYLCEYTGSYDTFIPILTNNVNQLIEWTAPREMTIVLCGALDSTESMRSCKIQRERQIGKAASEESVIELQEQKQDALISGTTIKTINGESILGEGNLQIQAGSTNSSLSVGYKEALDDILDFWIAPSTDKFLNGCLNYLDDKIDSVPEGQHFIFVSDCHWITNKKKSPALIDYVRKRLNIKTIIHGGDVENESENLSNAVKQWTDFNKEFVGRIGTDFKQVCGDHDHNASHVDSTWPSQTPFSCQLVQKLLNGYNEGELVFDHLYDNQIINFTEEEKKEYYAFQKLHYYFDDKSINTRFIVLFTGWSGGNYGIVHDKIGDAYQGESKGTLCQLEFLESALMTLPSGYNVVVCGHNTIANNRQTVEGETRYDRESLHMINCWSQVSYLLRKFKTKTSIASFNYIDWSGEGEKSKTFDFTNAPDCNICICLGGDLHWDLMARYNGTNTIPINNGDTVPADNIAQIVIMTDGYDRGYKYVDGEYCAPQIVNGTITEQAFDIVTFAEDTIYFTRIGAGEDRMITVTP